MKIRAITFDAGGTLIEPWPSVGHVYAEVANRHGKEVSSDELNRRFVSAWRTRKNFAYSSQAWARLVDEVFSGLTTELPSRTFFDELYEPKPLFSSKINTGTQIILVAAVIALMGFPYEEAGLYLKILIVGTAMTTVVSGTEYLMAWWRQMNKLEQD